jgi:hypothetical protein
MKGELVITCPKTGKTVSTRFTMSKQIFEEPSNTIENSIVQCSACGQMHTWSKKDARWQEKK